jgi:hypothetical protein
LPIDLHNHHVYLPVHAGGRAWSFLLDTGASASLLSLRVASELDLPLGNPIAVQGAGAGSLTGAFLRQPIDMLPAGETGFALPVIGAMPFDALEPCEGRAIDGILGFDFISRNVVEIDYPSAALRLHDPAGFEHRGGVRLPIELKHNHPHVEGSLEIEPGVWVTGDFVLDVGSRLAVALSKPFRDRHQLLARLALTVPSALGRGVGGEASSDVGHARTLRIGDLVSPRPEVALFGDDAGVFTSGAYFDGNIGGAILSRYRIFLDYLRRTVILQA